MFMIGWLLTGHMSTYKWLRRTHGSKKRFQIIIIGRRPCMGDKLSHIIFFWCSFEELQSVMPGKPFSCTAYSSWNHKQEGHHRKTTDLIVAWHILFTSRSFLGRLLSAAPNTGNELTTWWITRFKAETSIKIFYVEGLFASSRTSAFDLSCFSNHHVRKLKSEVKKSDSWSSLLFMRGENRSNRGKTGATPGKPVWREVRRFERDTRKYVFILLFSLSFFFNRKKAFEADLLARTWSIKYEDIKWPKNKGKFGSKKGMVR